jgi:cytochrome P450
MKGNGIGSEIPLLRIIGPYVPLRSFREMFRADDYLFKYSQRAVTNSRKNSDSCRNIFSGLVYETEKDGSALSNKEVAIEAGNLIVAGSDTTAVTLTYLIWAILSHPSLRLQIEEELNGLDDDYSEATLESLPILNATITETLRLYGAAPGSLPRTVPEGGVTLSGFYIPAGTTVSTQSYTIHRDPALFPDSEKFDPSRWLAGDKEASDHARMALSPFGAGSRSCLGIHISYMELRLGTAEFFRRCEDVRLAPSVTDESMRPEHYFLIAPSAHKCEILMGAPSEKS